MGLILWIIAAILVIVGIVQLIQGQIILAIVLFVVAAAVGPGGWSVVQPAGLTATRANAGGGLRAAATSSTVSVVTWSVVVDHVAAVVALVVRQ